MSYRRSNSDKFSGPRTPSEQTFECYVCRDKYEVPGIRCRLAGKDENGYPIRMELDGITAHRHRKKGDKAVMTFPQQQQQQQQQQTAMEMPADSAQLTAIQTTLQQQRTNINALIQNVNMINQKLDVIITSLKRDPNDDDGDSSREDPEEEP